MQYLTDREVSAKLAIPLQTLRNWRYLRKGPAYIKLNRHVRYRAEDVDSYMLRHMVEVREDA